MLLIIYLFASLEMNKEGKDYKDSKEEEGKGDEPLAYVNLSGQIIECNQEFAKLAGSTPKDLVNSDLTALGKFADPNVILEAAFQLDQLGSGSTPADHWQTDLKPIASHDDEYVIYVKRAVHKVHAHKVLEAVIKPASHFAQNKLRYSFRRNSFKSGIEALDNATAEQIAESKPHQRVLIVEDSPTSLKLMARMINNLGHKVSTAVNGIDALELLRTETFDIVLMDINMPMMNGLQASHEFRKLERANRASGKPYQKIIAMSGDISNTLFQEVSNAGFDAFIPKPLTQERFLEVLNLPVSNAFK